MVKKHGSITTMMVSQEEERGVAWDLARLFTVSPSRLQIASNDVVRSLLFSFPDFQNYTQEKVMSSNLLSF